MIFKDLEPIEKAFRSVAPYILEHAGHEVLRKKSDGTPVTEIDIEVERRIKKIVANAYHGIDILGEETGYNPNELPKKCWIIDPIDGTKSFIKNIPTYTTMAVYIEDDETLACVIYNPNTDEMFKAIKQQGAYLNSQKLDIRNTSLPSKAVAKAAFVSAINNLSPPVAVETPPSGAGFPFSQIAKGALAARFNFSAHGYIHDYATGILLILEAGGDIIAINDEEISIHSQSFVACHPKLTSFVHENKEKLATIEKTYS